MDGWPVKCLEQLLQFIIWNNCIYSSYVRAQFFTSLLNETRVQLDFPNHLSNVSASTLGCIQELIEGKAFLINHISIG